MTELNLASSKEVVESQKVLNLKIICLWIFGGIVSFIFGFLLKNLFSSVNLSLFFWSFIMACIFLIVYLIEIFFINNYKMLALIVFSYSFIIVLPFITKSISIVSFGFIIFLILLWGNFSGRRILLNQMKINFGEVSRGILPNGIMAIALFIAAVTPIYLNGNDTKFPFSPFLFHEIIDSGSFLTNKFLPDFTPTSTLEEVVLSTYSKKLADIPGSDKLSESAKQSMLKQGANEFYDRILSITGVEINPKLNISDSLYQITKQRFNSLSNQHKNIIFIIISIAIFFVIASISRPLRMIISFFGFITYELLLAVGFAKIELENHTKEIIIM